MEIGRYRPVPRGTGVIEYEEEGLFLANKENMFGSFDAAVEQREQEQQQIEAAVTGKALAKARTGRPKKRKDATSMTLIVSAEDKQKVKQYAYDHALTVSDLFHMWITEHCRDE